MKKSLTGTLYELLEKIKGSADNDSLDLFAKEILLLREPADDARRHRIDHFIANHLLELPSEDEMTASLKSCIDTCLDGAWQYKTKATMLAKSVEELCGIELKTLDGKSGALLTREPTAPERLRASFFNERGFYGDMNRASTLDVIDELWQDGFRYLSPGILQKMSISREWSEGSAGTADIQQVNLGNLPFEQYQKNARCRQHIKIARDVFWALSRQISGEELFSHFVKSVSEKTDVTPTKRLFDALQKDPDGFISPEADLFEPAEKPVEQLFWYGLRARPASPGSVPEGFCQQIAPNDVPAHLKKCQMSMAEPDYRHGMVAYPMPLTPKQVSDYELKMPLDRSRPPAPDGDLNDPEFLRTYAIALHREGWVSRNEVSSVFKDHSALFALVSKVVEIRRDESAVNRPR